MPQANPSYARRSAKGCPPQDWTHSFQTQEDICHGADRDQDLHSLACCLQDEGVDDDARTDDS